MKLKLYNGQQSITNLIILGGGYDQDSGRVQLIVRGDTDQHMAGFVQFEVTEAYMVSKLLTQSTPQVTRVDVVAEDPGAKEPGASTVLRKRSVNERSEP